jgi:hypothetical protein
MEQQEQRPAETDHATDRPKLLKAPRLPDPQLIRSEVNLLVFPFFALTTKGLKGKLETEFRAAAERDGQRVEIFWNVSANPKYGYPGPFDRQVHRAIEQIITRELGRRGRIENPLALGSLYDLCQRMGKKASRDGRYSGRVYKAIKQALERIAATTIKSGSTFYHKGKRRWTSEIFHLYDAAVFRGKELEDGRIADTNYLYLSDLYLQSLNSFYVKPLDYQYQRTLRSPIASRLYEILGVKFYGVRDRRQAQVCFRYSTLTQLLPVEQHQYLARAKQQLNPAHEELISTGFLAACEWSEPQGDGDWLIYYRPGERAKEEIRRARAERPLTSDGQEGLPGITEQFEPELPTEKAAERLSGEEEDLIRQLLGLNVSEIKARDLVKRSDPNAVRTWIEAIQYSQAQDKAAFLVRAIQENWQVSEAYLKAKAEQERQQRLREAELARQEKEQEKETRRQREAQELDRLYESLSPEQRAEVERETEARIPASLQERIRQQRSQGEFSHASNVILGSNRHEVLRSWLKEGKLRA